MEMNYKEPVSCFDHGLQVLEIYHQTFLEKGQQLTILMDKITQQEIDESSASQCRALFNFYSHALFLHHRDEEQALFPVLLDQSSLVIGMIERLMMDHEEIEESWQQLAKYLEQPENIRSINSFSERARAFEKLLREHLTREDKDFAPLVKKILDEQQIKRTGQKMSALRGQLQSN